mmetsp:Transcript_84038/g.235457  ORF Transcript_84038/g.235457 Transcript_84038/m.235457 type:complete len:96 (+) Transcript_84038:681-968(+)
MADHPSLEALYTHANSLSCNDVPAVSDFSNSLVRRGLEGGEPVTPETQFSTENIDVLETEGDFDVAGGAKLEASLNNIIDEIHTSASNILTAATS